MDGEVGAMWGKSAIATLLLAAGLASPCAAQAFDGPDSAAVADSLLAASTQKHFGRAALEVTGANVGIWLWCRYIREGGTNTGFRIGIQSWKENLINGFEWDDNQFDTNQLAHPYHGSMYFCAARANGYDYWESMAFSFAGSAMWEYLGETHHPSINDWISTGYGGVAFGEMLHRFSGMIVDQGATGSERAWREVGGLLVNPMGGINRLITGDLTRVGPNVPGRHPERFRTTLRTGPRFTGEETLTNADTTRLFFRLRGVYGDPAGGECRTPFDAFHFDLQANFGDASLVGRAQIYGLLRSWQLSRSENSVWYFAFVNNYDYVNNWAYTYGGQSVGGSVFTRRVAGDWRIDAGLALNWIILGATTSDYASYTGRSYDYGPGGEGKLHVVLRGRGRGLLAFESETHHLRIMNGTDARHTVVENRLTLDLPVRGPLGVGAEYSLYHARRDYADYPDVDTRAPQLTAYLSWGALTR